jgi:hypothetical protein
MNVTSREDVGFPVGGEVVGGWLYRPARRAGERAPNGEVRDYDLGHFDIYVGEPFERALADQVDFLRRHLA